MSLRTIIAAIALTFSFGATAQAATTNYVLDTSASSIKVNYNSGCKFMKCTRLTGSFNNFNWTASGAADSTSTNSLINWAVTGQGMVSFNVVANLVFSSPIGANGGAAGAGSLNVKGKVVNGYLVWNSVAQIVSGNAVLDVNFDNWKIGLSGITNPTFQSGAQFSYSNISNVPLPASVPLMMVGLAGLGYFGRRKKKA